VRIETRHALEIVALMAATAVYLAWAIRYFHMYV